MPAVADELDTDQTVKAIAERRGVSRQSIYNWSNDGCPIRGSDEQIDEWLDENRPMRDPTGRQKRESNSLKTQLLEAQIAKAREDCREKKLRNDLLQSELVYRDEACLEFAELVGMIRAEIESWPSQLETEWPLEVRALVTEHLRDRAYLLLVRMSQFRASSVGMNGHGRKPTNDQGRSDSGHNGADGVSGGEAHGATRGNQIAAATGVPCGNRTKDSESDR